MNILKKYGLNTILLGVVIVLLVLVLFKTSPDYVIANGDGGAGAKHVFAIVGNRANNRESFYLVDTRQEVIMVYEYGVQGDGLGLTYARSYKYDKLLEQYGRSSFGPKVEKIEDIFSDSHDFIESTPVSSFLPLLPVADIN